MNENRETETEILGELDHEDMVLLKTMRTADPVARVDATGTRGAGAVQSHDARAWTMGGRVD